MVYIRSGEDQLKGVCDIGILWDTIEVYKIQFLLFKYFIFNRENKVKNKIFDIKWEIY